MLFTFVTVNVTGVIEPQASDVEDGAKVKEMGIVIGDSVMVILLILSTSKSKAGLPPDD